MADEPFEAVDWGNAGGDKTIITLTVGDRVKSAAKVTDAIAWLRKEYPGAEIQVRDHAGGFEIIPAEVKQ